MDYFTKLGKEIIKSCQITRLRKCNETKTLSWCSLMLMTVFFSPSVSTEADEPLAAYLGVHMDVLYSHLEEGWDTRNKYFEPVKQLKLYFMPAAVLERCTES